MGVSKSRMFGDWVIYLIRERVLHTKNDSILPVGSRFRIEFSKVFGFLNRFQSLYDCVNHCFIVDFQLVIILC